MLMKGFSSSSSDSDSDSSGNEKVYSGFVFGFSKEGVMERVPIYCLKAIFFLFFGQKRMRTRPRAALRSTNGWRSLFPYMTTKPFVFYCCL